MSSSHWINNVTIVLIGATIGTCFHVPQMGYSEKDKERAAWEIDLKRVGYSVSETAPPENVEAMQQIAFGSNQELVVLGAVDSFPSLSVVHAFIIETKTGSMVAQANWKTRSLAYIFPGAKGEYATLTEVGMVLYSQTLRKVIAKRDGLAAVFASPDGRSLATRNTGPGPAVALFLDAETLQPTGVAFSGHNVESIGRDRITYSAYVKDARQAAVHIENPGGVIAIYRTDCGEVRSYFISDEVLAVIGCGKVDVITASGERVVTFRTDGVSSFAGASRDGRRFAVVEAYYGTGDDPKLFAERFRVFDVNERTSVLTRDILDLRGRESGRSGAALSPDGSALAVNSLGVVRLFRID